jgi:hypothetical protein
MVLSRTGERGCGASVGNVDVGIASGSNVASDTIVDRDIIGDDGVGQRRSFLIIPSQQRTIPERFVF